MKLNQVTLPVHDLPAASAFYETLGFVPIVRTDHYMRFELPPDHNTLSLELTDAPIGKGASLYFECEDLDARVATLAAKGVIFESPPQDKDWRWREAWVTDPSGNRLCFYFAGENRRFPPWRLG